METRERFKQTTDVWRSVEYTTTARTYWTYQPQENVNLAKKEEEDVDEKELQLHDQLEFIWKNQVIFFMHDKDAVFIKTHTQRTYLKRLSQFSSW